MNLLIKPLITEKSMHDASRGVYTFIVKTSATKSQLKELVQTLFKVKVTKLTTTTTKPATKKTGRRRLSTATTPTKLARLWLKAGQSISLFDLKEEK